MRAAGRLVRMAPPGACASPELLFAALREMSEERQRTDGEREKASAELASARSSAGALHAECEGIETHLKRCRDALRGQLWRALLRPVPAPARRSIPDAMGQRYRDALGAGP